MKRTLKAGGLGAVAALAIASLMGCGNPVNSAESAAKAAAVIGVGPTSAQNGKTSATARTIEAVRSIDAKTLGVDAGLTWESPNGGSITFSAEASANMPGTDQTVPLVATPVKIVYADLKVKDSAGLTYTISGTAYAYLSLSLSPAAINLIITSDAISISSTALADTCDVDYAISVTTDGYSTTGKVNGYSFTSSFSL